MITLIMLGLFALSIMLACAHLVCALYDSEDLHKMGIGR